MKTTDLVEELLKPKVEELGFELCDVEYVKEYGNWVLTLYIDREGGVDLNACETVSRAVEPILDEKDPIEGQYYLSVSSLGLDRPIKKDRDFERSLGKAVVVRLYAPFENKKEWIGTLNGYDKDSFTILLEDGEREMTVLRKEAALIRPHIVF